MSYARLVKLIDAADRVALKAETDVADRVKAAVDAAYRAAVEDVRRRYNEVSDRDLAGKERAVLLLNELGKTLYLLDSDTGKQFEADLAELHQAMQAQGDSLAEVMAKTMEPGFTVRSTVRPNLEAAAYQAEDGLTRLRRHDADFALKASKAIEAGLVAGEGFAKVQLKLQDNLGAMRARAESIVRTESMAAMDSANRAGLERLGIEYYQRIATQDTRVCPTCAARAGDVFEVSVPVSLHPMERCYAAPWKKVWVDSGALDSQWIEAHKADVVAKAGGVNEGLSPFERLNGVAQPVPVWRVGPVKSVPIPEPQSGLATPRLPESELAELVGQKASLMAEMSRILLDLQSLQGDEFDEAVDRRIGMARDVVAINDKILEVFSDHRKALIESGLSFGDARGLISDVDFSALGSLAPKIKDWATEFHRITGGAIRGQVKRFGVSERAFADLEAGLVAVPDESSPRTESRRKETLWHEFAHFAEDAAQRRLDMAWLISRATRPGLEPLADLTGEPYDADEIAVPDSFLHPYIGRYYGGRDAFKKRPEWWDTTPTEVLSVGLEHFSSPEKMLEFYLADKEHYRLVEDYLERVRGGATPSKSKSKSKQKSAPASSGKTSPAYEGVNAADSLVSRGLSLAGKGLADVDAAIAAAVERSNGLKSEIAGLEADFDKMFDEDPSKAFSSETWAALSRKKKEVAAIAELGDAEALTAMSSFRGRLISGSAITRSDAEALAAKVKILKTASKRVPEVELRKTLADFFELTGGRGAKSIKKLEYRGARAYADIDGAVSIGSDTGSQLIETLYHEFGHHIEFESVELENNLNRWIDSRSTGEVKPLKELAASNYDDDEIARVDKFIDPYVGKVYENGSTEALSMGIQFFTDERAMLDLYRRDKEHFFVILGALQS